MRKKRRKRRNPQWVNVYLQNLQKQANWKDSLRSGLDLRGPKKPFSKNKLHSKSKTKSFGKLPKNIEITLNLVPVSQRRICDSKSLDVNIPVPAKNLKQAEKQISNLKFPSILSSKQLKPTKITTGAQTIANQDPKDILIT